MPTVSSMAPFHLLGQDAQNEMKHDISGHMMPLISTSCDAHGIINSTTAFVALSK